MAMKVVSSDVGIRGLKPGPNGERIECLIKGQPAMRLRVWSRKDGSVCKDFSLLATVKTSGQKKRFPIGEYPVITFEAAKKEAGRLRNEIAHEKDPSAEKKANAGAMTFQELVDEWLELRAKITKRSWPEDKRMLDHDILPKLGRVKANLITKTQVKEVQQTIAGRGSPIQSNRVLTLINTISNWGLNEGFVEENPADKITKLGVEKERKRSLKPHELVKVWLGLDGAKLSKGMRIAIRLLLLCGRRVNELAAARKSEFDFDQKLWTTPGARSMPSDRLETGMKGKEDHVLPLTDAMIKLLQQAFDIEPDSAWVFPGRWDKTVPVSEGAVSQAWKRIRGNWGLDDVTAHDLRRSFSTFGGECGFADFDIDLVTDHKDGRSQQGSRYNQALYLGKKLDVLEAVERYILETVESGRSETDVAPTPTAESPWSQITKQDLVTHLETQPATRIAVKYGVSEAAVRKRMKKWGIERKPRKLARGGRRGSVAATKPAGGKRGRAAARG